MNKNSCYIEPIDFYIEKPDDWVFIPTQWAITIKNKERLANEEISELMSKSNTPFVYMHKPLNRNDIAHPTVQSTCRYYETPTPVRMKRLLEQNSNILINQFNSVEIVEKSSEKVLSDCLANYIKARFLVKNEDGVDFACTSRSWQVFFNNIAYTIGLSGSSENEPDYGHDIDFILQSILIGKSIY